MQIMPCHYVFQTCTMSYKTVEWPGSSAAFGLVHPWSHLVLLPSKGKVAAGFQYIHFRSSCGKGDLNQHILFITKTTLPLLLVHFMYIFGLDGSYIVFRLPKGINFQSNSRISKHDVLPELFMFYYQTAGRRTC